MMTKTDFCQMTIDKWKRDNNVDEVTEDDVFQSSCLGIAMDYLGLIKDKHIKEYLSSRGGIFFTHYINPIKSLSFRELLELLPEEI